MTTLETLISQLQNLLNNNCYDAGKCQKLIQQIDKMLLVQLTAPPEESIVLQLFNQLFKASEESIVQQLFRLLSQALAQTKVPAQKASLQRDVILLLTNILVHAKKYDIRQLAALELKAFLAQEAKSISEILMAQFKEALKNKALHASTEELSIFLPDLKKPGFFKEEWLLANLKQTKKVCQKTLQDLVVLNEYPIDAAPKLQRRLETIEHLIEIQPDLANEKIRDQLFNLLTHQCALVQKAVFNIFSLILKAQPTLINEQLTDLLHALPDIGRRSPAVPAALLLLLKAKPALTNYQVIEQLQYYPTVEVYFYAALLDILSMLLKAESTLADNIIIILVRHLTDSNPSVRKAVLDVISPELTDPSSLIAQKIKSQLLKLITCARDDEDLAYVCSETLSALPELLTAQPNLIDDALIKQIVYYLSDAKLSAKALNVLSVLPTARPDLADATLIILLVTYLPDSLSASTLDPLALAKVQPHLIDDKMLISLVNYLPTSNELVCKAALNALSALLKARPELLVPNLVAQCLSAQTSICVVIINSIPELLTAQSERINLHLISQLVNCLASPENLVWIPASEVLSQLLIAKPSLASQTISQFLKYLSDEKDDNNIALMIYRIAKTTAQSALVNNEMINQFANYLAHNNSKICIAALLALSMQPIVGNDKIINKMVAFLSDQMICIIVLEILSQQPAVGNAGIIEKVVNCLIHPNKRVRVQTLKTLSAQLTVRPDLANDEIINKMVNCLTDKDELVRKQTLNTLLALLTVRPDLGNKIASQSVKYLTDTSNEVREAAIKLVMLLLIRNQLTDSEMVEKLCACFKEEKMPSVLALLVEALLLLQALYPHLSKNIITQACSLDISKRELFFEKLLLLKPEFMNAPWAIFSIELPRTEDAVTIHLHTVIKIWAWDALQVINAKKVILLPIHKLLNLLSLCPVEPEIRAPLLALLCLSDQKFIRLYAHEIPAMLISVLKHAELSGQQKALFATALSKTQAYTIPGKDKKIFSTLLCKQKLDVHLLHTVEVLKIYDASMINYLVNNFITLASMQKTTQEQEAIKNALFECLLSYHSASSDLNVAQYKITPEQLTVLLNLGEEQEHEIITVLLLCNFSSIHQDAEVSDQLSNFVNSLNDDDKEKLSKKIAASKPTTEPAKQSAPTNASAFFASADHKEINNSNESLGTAPNFKK